MRIQDNWNERQPRAIAERMVKSQIGDEVGEHQARCVQVSWDLPKCESSQWKWKSDKPPFMIFINFIN